MSILADLRREYPEFRDMSDRELTQVLRKKYYANMPEKEFQRQISTSVSFPESKYIPPAAVPVTTAASTPPRPAAQNAGLPGLKEVKPAGLFDYFTDREQAIKQDREYRSYLQERQQRETLEDLKTNTGFMDFVGDLFSSGLLNLRSGIKDVEATIERNPELKKKFQEEARRYAKNANAEVAGSLTTEDVKENWLKVVPFALQEFARSAPSLVAMPLGAVGLAGQVARGRAEANGREDVSGTDLAIAAPVAAVSTVLDRFGLGEIIGAAGKTAVIRTVKAFGAEGTTEGAQELIEYLGSRVGTEKGADAREAFEQAMWGAIIGGTAGGTLRGAGELVSAPFRKPAQTQTDQDIAASPQGIAEFQRLASEAVAQVMEANPGMSRNDAVNIVMEQAEKLRVQAVANVQGTEGELDVDTRLDVTGGGRAGVPTDLEPGGAAVGAAEFGEPDTGRLGEPVSGVPVSDVGEAAGERPLRKATAEEVAAAIPIVEEAFDLAAIDFEDNYGVTELTGAQKQMAARMVVEGVDVFDAIDNLLQKQERAPSLDQQAVAPVKQVVETVTAPTPGAVVPSIEETAAKETGIAAAPTTEEMQAGQQKLNEALAGLSTKADEARAAIQAQAAQAPSEEQPTPTVEETLTEEKMATPATKTLNDMAGAGSVNPENTNEVLVGGGGVQLTPVADNVVQVDSLRAVETGGGRKAMEQLVQIADANGTELQLSPEPFAAPAGKEMSPTELTEWYKGFGFQEQPDGSMVRPAAAPPSTITPSAAPTAQQVLENIDEFARTEAQDRELDPDMFLNGVADIREGREPLDPVAFAAQFGFTAPGEKLRFSIEERPVDVAYAAYKAGTQFAQERIADATTQEQRAEAPGSIIGGAEVDINAFRGRTLDELLNHIASNVNGTYSAFDMRLADRLNSLLFRLQEAGFGVTLHVLQKGDSAPASIARGSARGAAIVDLKARKVDVYLRSPDLGKSGGSTEIILHETLHAVSMGVLMAAKRGRGTPEMVQFRKDLNDLRNKVITHFNNRVKSVGKQGLTAFELSMYERKSNAFADVDEFLTWGLTNKLAQDYLRSIEIGPKKSLFNSFVDAFRSLLGINPRDTSALAHLTDIVSPLFDMTAEDFKATATEKTESAVASIEDVAASLRNRLRRGVQQAQQRLKTPESAEQPVAEEAQEPITEEAVDKAVSVKLTKAQMKRLETAAGIRRKELNNMQKRIVQSRNTNETLGLIGRLTKIAHKYGEDGGLIASITRMMPPAAYKFLLGFQQIETVFAVARNAGVKSLAKVDDLMRNGYIPYVNRIVMAARDIDEMWGDFASKNEAGNIALDDVIMISNMMNVDPSQAATAADYMLIDEDLRGLQWKLMQSKDEGEKKSLRNQIGRRKEEIKRVYFGGQETTETGETVQVAGWNDVPPEGRKIYTAARDFYRSNFNEHYRLLMQRIDDAGLDKEDAARVKSSIKKMFEKARERVIYFPVKRFGEYWVSVGNDFYMRESLAEQEALVDRLEKEGETREITAAYGRENLRNLVANKDASGALKDILDLLDDSNTPNADGTAKITDMDDLRDLVFQMYLTALPEADMRRRFIHREFKTGFSTDALRTFASTAVASANQLGRLAYNYKFDAAIAEAKKETEKNPMKSWLDTLTNEVDLKVKGVMSPQQDDLMDAVVAFANKLTFFNLLSSPSSAFMNLTQLHIVGLPVLSAEFGEAKTAEMASRYTASFLLGQEIPNPLRNEEGNIELQAPDFRFENSGYMRRLKESDPERYEQTLAAWNFAKEHDVIESTFSASSELYQRSNVPTGDFTFRQAARRGDVLTAAQRATANTINGMGYMFHKSEVIGRSIMYMSSFDLAYERAIKQGKTAEEAGIEARSLAAKLTNKGMFDFSNWNKPRFAQTRLGRLALQMQSYRQSMNMLLFRSFVRMLPLMNKEGKLAAARVFFGVAGMTALYGGLRATHISGLVLGAYTVMKFVESLADDDDDEEKEVEQDYLTEDTIEKELMKFADENGNELAMKDAEYYIRAHWIPETFGKGSTLANALGLSDETAAKLAAVADMGLPALGGVDLSNSVALNEFWTPVEAKGNTPEVRALETLARYGLGPTAASLAQYVKAAQAWNEGDINKGFEAMLPAIIRNQVKAERLASEGLRVGKNEDIVLKDPTYYTSGKSALISMGFRDAETSRNMQLDIAAGKIEDEVAAEQIKLLDRRYRAILDFEANPSKENEREWNRAERAIDIYNLNYPSNTISAETKAKSLKAKRREAADKAYGLGYDPDIPVRMPLVEERAEQLADEEQ